MGEGKPVTLYNLASEGQEAFGEYPVIEDATVDLQRQWRKQIGAPSCKSNTSQPGKIKKEGNGMNTGGLSLDISSSDTDYSEDPMDELKDDSEPIHARQRTDGFIGVDDQNQHDPLDLGDEFILKPDSELKLKR